MKGLEYILKEEIRDTEFGKAKVYSVYIKHLNEETFDCFFGIKEKAMKYVESMNDRN